jgi:hypothetical protein
LGLLLAILGAVDLGTGMFTDILPGVSKPDPNAAKPTVDEPQSKSRPLLRGAIAVVTGLMLIAMGSRRSVPT